MRLPRDLPEPGGVGRREGSATSPFLREHGAARWDSVRYAIGSSAVSAMRLVTALCDPLPGLDIERDWAAAPRLWGHSLHALCSYVGSFPPSLAHALICRFSRPGDVVADPFAGRGTVPLEARIEGRIGIGGDLNPLADLLTRAKTVAVSPEAIVSRFAQLRHRWGVEGAYDADFDDVVLRVADEDGLEIALAFHPVTLGALIWLRSNLRRGDPIDDFLLACLAGVLHGPGDAFLTDVMSNALSRSRLSVRANVLARGRLAPRREVFGVLGRKLNRVLADGMPLTHGVALNGDARTFGLRSREWLRSRALPGARLVVTSPPYLGVLRYGQFNWLRLWLIGSDATAVDNTLAEHRVGKYAEFMSQVLDGLRACLAPDAVIAMVLGDVRLIRGHAVGGPPLAEVVWEMAAAPSGYRLVGVITDRVTADRKVTKMWGPLAGAATRGETILVLATGSAGYRRARAAADLPVPWPDRSSIQRRSTAGLRTFSV